jgi:hypothetical protein
LKSANPTVVVVVPAPAPAPAPPGGGCDFFLLDGEDALDDGERLEEVQAAVAPQHLEPPHAIHVHLIIQRLQLLRALGLRRRSVGDGSLDTRGEDLKQAQSIELPIKVNQEHAALAPAEVHVAVT